MPLIQNKQIGDLLDFGKTETAAGGLKTVTIPVAGDNGNIRFNCKNTGWSGISVNQPWNGACTLYTLMMNNDVAGLRNYMGWFAANGTIAGWVWYCQDGVFYTKSTGTISDRREKTNIQPMGAVLDKVTRLNPVQFKWIDETRNVNPLSLGLIAQEVLDVFPLAVRKGSDPFKSDEDQLYSVDPLQLIAIAMKAIQELTARVESLEASTADTAIG